MTDSSFALCEATRILSPEYNPLDLADLEKPPTPTSNAIMPPDAPPSLSHVAIILVSPLTSWVIVRRHVMIYTVPSTFSYNVEPGHAPLAPVSCYNHRFSAILTGA